MAERTGASLAAQGAIVAAVVVAVAAAVVWWQRGAAPEPVPVISAPPASGTTEPAAGASPAPAAPVVADAAAPAATPAEPSEVSPAPEPPRFDTVRVTPEGEALVAGRAAPGAEVSVRVDGQEVAVAMADGAGAFVAMFTLPGSDQPRLLTLLSRHAGAELPSGQSVALEPTAPVAVAAAPDAPAPQAAPEPQAPAAILLDAGGAATVLQGAPVAEGAGIAIATITYMPDGAVQLAGRAEPGAAVRLYLDNAEAGQAVAGSSGAWVATLRGVAPGLYTLRADQIGADGRATARFETPFQRETPEALAAVLKPRAVSGTPVAAAPLAPSAVAPPVPATPPAAPEQAATEPPPLQPVSVTVQPGFTLWRIARENFGDGVLYVKVFEANKDQIRNPDLIYPGQVFTIPEE